MERHPIPSSVPSTQEHIPLSPKPFGKSRHFGAFLICCALFVAGFALTALWSDADGKQWKDEAAVTDPIVQNPTTDPILPEIPPQRPLQEPIPEGATPIVTYDLSHLGQGIGYLNNQTSYKPDVNALLQTDVTVSPTRDPLVLVLHTHTSEGYLPDSATYLDGDLGEITYTRESERNVLAVGEAFVKVLKENGISAIHCTVMHDESGFGGSYERAAQSIRFFREQYPSIQYVVDIHRDAILTAEGDYVRAATEIDGKPVAQILPVVGSNARGWKHDAWEGNLSLALQMREKLNQNNTALCRPVMLREATYNQEMAPFAILLEIGTGANAIDEAVAAATLAGRAFAKVILSH